MPQLYWRLKGGHYALLSPITQFYKQTTVGMRSNSAINPVTMENTGKLPTQPQEATSCYHK